MYLYIPLVASMVFLWLPRVNTFSNFAKSTINTELAALRSLASVAAVGDTLIDASVPPLGCRRWLELGGVCPCAFVDGDDVDASSVQWDLHVAGRRRVCVDWFSAPSRCRAATMTTRPSSQQQRMFRRAVAQYGCNHDVAVIHARATTAMVGQASSLQDDQEVDSEVDDVNAELLVENDITNEEVEKDSKGTVLHKDAPDLRAHPFNGENTVEADFQRSINIEEENHQSADEDVGAADVVPGHAGVSNDNPSTSTSLLSSLLDQIGQEQLDLLDIDAPVMESEIVRQVITINSLTAKGAARPRQVTLHMMLDAAVAYGEERSSYSPSSVVRLARSVEHLNMAGYKLVSSIVNDKCVQSVQRRFNLCLPIYMDTTWMLVESP